MNIITIIGTIIGLIFVLYVLYLIILLVGGLVGGIIAAIITLAGGGATHDDSLSTPGRSYEDRVKPSFEDRMKIRVRHLEIMQKFKQ